ncbi:MAG: glycosyltransferase family 39 protein [Prevotella sp.]|nr:glycosyltransferase family 39 protein [Prevotella sp.]
MTTTLPTAKDTTAPRPLNWWAVYGICLLISTIFFFLYGFNSPLYTFNSDNDYHWFMTVGHGFAGGKIPYRDLFEHKGPIVYFVTAFACLFANPDFVMLLLEIFCMSWFFFFTYRIAHKRLNTFYSLTVVSIMAMAIFTCWCRMRSAATVEEFCLPIYAYFLLCWLEFLLEKKSWTWVRALCLGLCFGICLWVKYTLFYFMLVPMLAWFILSLRRRQYRTLVTNLLLMLAGVVIISVPIVIFFVANHAFGDLLHVYFFINLTAYGTANVLTILGSFGVFFTIGPIVLFFMLWGVIRFAIRYWRERAGWILLTAFLVTLSLLVWSSKQIAYYYGELIPYAILGVVDLLAIISAKLSIAHYRQLIYTAITAVCVLISLPFSIHTYELGRSEKDYVPLQIAAVIQDYETQNDTAATLFCYKIGDFGFYNAAGIVPNNYYFANNVFDVDRFPAMYAAFTASITDQTSDFVITDPQVWEDEQDFLAQYYHPYTGDIETSTYHYHKVHYFYYKNFDFVLLYKNV